MNFDEAKRRAFKLWIESATLSNDFTPITERALSDRLKAEGYEVSCSAINRWKKKHGWKEALELEITASVSNDERVSNIVKAAGLSAFVENTKVDNERVNTLQASSYEALEILMGRYLRRLKVGEELNKDERKEIISIGQFSTAVKEALLNRLNNMPFESMSSQELIASLKDAHVELEDVILESSYD